MAETVIHDDAEMTVYRDEGGTVGEPGHWTSERVVWKAGSAEANRLSILDAARQALVTNRTYIAIASPTAAQTAAQVKALSRQNNGIIRLMLNALDGTD